MATEEQQTSEQQEQEEDGSQQASGDGSQQQEQQQASGDSSRGPDGGEATRAEEPSPQSDGGDQDDASADQDDDDDQQKARTEGDDRSEASAEEEEEQEEDQEPQSVFEAGMSRGDSEEEGEGGSDSDEDSEAKGESEDEAEGGEAESEESAEAESSSEEQDESEESEADEEEEDRGPSGAELGTQAATLAEMIATATTSYSGTALKFKNAGGEWQEVSYTDLGENLKRVAKGLVALGIEHGDKVAIFSDTRADWTLCDLAAISIGAVVAPIYQTSSADEARHVLSDSGAKLCFCENAGMVEKVQEVRDDCPQLEHLVVIEGDAKDTMSLNDVGERGEEVSNEQLNERAENVSPDDLFTIVYTSGTTGPPKGCLLTHGNYRANIEMCENAVEWGEDPTILLFLPLAHVLTRILQMLILDVGGTIAFWEEDKDKILDNLQEVEPTHFAAVPRIFEKIYGRATAEAEGNPIKRKAFWKAVDVGRQVREHDERGEEPGPILRESFEEADKRVLSKVRDLFGSNLQFAATGAAPVQKEMLEFFFACGVKILEGYGATETSAVATINRPHDFEFGTVGKALPGSEIEIADEDGEILIRGPHVFQGYHNLEEETKEDLDEDGWYHTGDVGELDDDGFLSITGRKKDIIVTSSGKNIASGYIENKIAASRWVSHTVVYGDDKPYLVALVTLDQDERDALLEEAGTSGDGDIANDDKVRAEIQKAIDAANEDLARVEQVKKFTIVDRELSQEDGEVTPTMKVKRNVVYENFEEEFEGLYEDGEGGEG